MATIDQLERALIAADRAGAADDARAIAAEIRRMRGSAKGPGTSADPTDDMSTMERARAGLGRGMVAAGRAFKQALDVPATALERTFGGESISRALGMPTAVESQRNTAERIEEARRLDKPLLDTTAGTVGNAIGMAAPAALAVPFTPATIAGAFGAGGITGAALTEGGIGDRLGGAVAGAAGGAVGALIPGAVRVGGGIVRGLVEPFTAAGQGRIAGRTLQRFGVTPQATAGATSAPTVTGAAQTLAEQITDPQAAAGAARLQDAIRAIDPQAAGRFAAREAENNAARVDALRQMTGSDGGRDFARANRAGTSGPMYDEAFSVDAASRLTPEMQRTMQQLMRSPAIRQASAAARANAANAGRNVGPANASGSVQGLHNVKLALDDMIAQARGGAGSAAQETKAQALEDARRRLIGFIEQISPEYASARGVHAQMSRPINQMDVASEILRRGTSATSDLAGTQRLMPNALMGALRDENALVRAATGRRLGGLGDVLDPDQVALVRAVAQETDRAGAVARAANGPGSATAQRMASQNLLRQIAGPFGVPESWIESTLAQNLLRPVQFGLQAAEPRIAGRLADAVLDPAQANALIQAARVADAARPANALELLARRLGPAALANASSQGAAK